MTSAIDETAALLSAQDRAEARQAPYVVATIRADTAEAEESERQLSATLARRGVVLIAATSEDEAVWDEDAVTKSSFIRDVWAQSEVPVLWLDIGARDADTPDLTALSEADFGVHDRGRRHDSATSGSPDLATSFLWFAKTDGARRLLDAWVEEAEAGPSLSDEAHLASAWTRVEAVHRLRTAFVPASHAGVRGSDAMRGVAVPHARSLFETRDQPYYIVAPDFTETSAGIYAVHGLCHALTSAGHEAYVAGAKRVNPMWNTPLLTEQQIQAHRAAGLEPIAVYPEITFGNPLRARTVARYVLNVPGVISGRPMGEAADDLLFYYSPQFIEGRDPRDVDFLMTPTIDPKVFHADPAVTRDKVLIYQHRFPLEQIDRSLFPPEAEILSMSRPLSLPDLARLFQRTKVLYSYELSSTCSKAMACGCPVIYRPEGGLISLPGTFLYGENGAAMATEVGGLERATSTVGNVATAIGGWEQTYWEQLAVFVRKTQQAANSRARA